MPVVMADEGGEESTRVAMARDELFLLSAALVEDVAQCVDAGAVLEPAGGDAANGLIQRKIEPGIDAKTALGLVGPWSVNTSLMTPPKL